MILVLLTAAWLTAALASWLDVGKLLVGLFLFRGWERLARVAPYLWPFAWPYFAWWGRHLRGKAP